MNGKIRLLVLMAAFFTLTGCSCGDDDDNDDDTHNADDDTDDDVADDDDDSADDDADDDGPQTTWDLNLTLEYRNAAHLVLEMTGDHIAATIRAGEGWGNEWLPADQPFYGTGRVMRFPEAGYEIHSVRFEAEAGAAGPCGDQPLMMELSLTGRTIAVERQGGIACYCGDSTGRPKEMLRIQTKVPLTEG